MRKGKDYPSSYKIKLFHIKYKNQLSPIAKLILKSFRWKNIYFAIDDIIYLLRSNPIERDQLLAILNSSVLSLQNNFCISFFDIWISEIYINEIPKFNKFINKNSQKLESVTWITIKFAVTLGSPVKKVELPW